MLAFDGSLGEDGRILRHTAEVTPPGGGGLNSDTAVVPGLSEALGSARGVDGVAVAALRAVVGIAGVTRAGLALTMVGGRQLRFLTSDDGRLGPEPSWCLIDAYDRLPLNDAVRSGRRIVLDSRE